ncbi:MAG TPA: response regulator transcription factor [Streptosporangiales bacterium]
MSDRARHTTRSVRVCLADDHRVFAEALTARLRREPGLELSGVATDRTAVLRLVAAERPDVLVLDLALGPDSGTELLPGLLAEQPNLRVVMLSGYDDTDLVVAAVRAGARAWVTKTADGADLVAAIETVAAGGAWFPPALLLRLLDRLVRPPAPSPEARIAGRLTPRELEILQCLVDGMAAKQIAHEFHLSEKTVRAHTQNLLSKLTAHSRAEAVAVALRLGMRPGGH